MRFSVFNSLLVSLSFLTSGTTAAEPAKTDKVFSIAAVADIQYADTDPRGAREPREGIARIKNAISHWNQRDLDWGVVLGDIIDWDDIDYGKFPRETIEKKPKRWQHTRDILAAWDTLKVPNYKVLGNHDYYVPYKDADGLSKPASVFRAFGFKDKAYYEFAHKGYRFIVLDGDMSHLNYDIESEEYKVAKAHYDSLKGPARGIWSAGISEKQMDWLKGVLADALKKKEPTVIMCHYPMHKPYGNHTLFNAVEMTTLLNSFPNVVMWLNGHNHAGGYADIEGRHHLNLKGMQNEAENWYQIDFGSESITVYQAEDLSKPKYELKLSWPLNKNQQSQDAGKNQK